MTSKPHDALFKAGFEAPEHAAAAFRAFLPPAVCAAIDWRSLEPVAGSFIDPALLDRHTDLLFSARIGDREILLYLLFEHQSTKDPDMPLRMLTYMVRIWERYRRQHPTGPLPLVIPTLLCNAPGGWTDSVEFHDRFEPHPASIPGLEELVPKFSLAIQDLIGVDNDTIKQWAMPPFPTLVSWVLRDARDVDTLLENLDDWVQTFNELLSHPGGTVATEQIFRHVLLVSGRVHFERIRDTLRDKLPTTEDAMQTIAEWLHEQGREEGREEGRQAGRQEGLRETLVTLLSSKFGELPPPRHHQLKTATLERLELYIRRLLDADTLDAVFDDARSD